MVSLILLLFVAFLLPGVINRTRARLSGCKGVTLAQHIHSLELQMHKGSVYSPVTSWVFRMAPIVYLGSLLTATLLIPVGYFDPLISFPGDLVLFCYLLGLSRFILILGALDTGSSFEGMGASREALYGALVEPALFILFGTLALVTGYISFSGLFTHLSGEHTQIFVVMLLMMYALIKIILVEGGRVPVDDPRTHLELTMIHEVMVLDYCGFDLGLITIGGWLKTAMLAMIASCALASTFYYNTLIIIAIALLVGVVIGVIESTMARGRLSRNATYILTIVALAFVLFMVGFLMVQEINI